MAVTYSVNFSLNSEYPMTSRQEKGWLCSEYCEHDIFTEDGTFFAFLEVRIFNVKLFFVCKLDASQCCKSLLTYVCEMN